MNQLKQRGATLINLLVGMVVSMLAILASLSMFHNLVQTSAEAKSDARLEGDISLAILRLDQELQAAGFNMGRAAGAGWNLDVFVTPEDVAATSAAAGVSQVAWRFNDGGAQPVCRRAVSSIQNGQYSLDLYDAAAGVCTGLVFNTANIKNTANWSTTPERIASIRLQNGFLRPLIIFNNSAAPAPCVPYGAAASGVTPASHPLLALMTYELSVIYGATSPPPDPTRTHTLCLVNIF